ncbi:hypothetical protein [Halobacteroides halobius]|uniref:hypothetical protein n=1 Tax=Halobacteroides halobius TaxID=42422 RepID=UPI0003142571|nr:hypothetical protein [Halobacteroides halobius]
MAFKILAVFAFLFTMFITFVNLVQAPAMGLKSHPNPLFALFNTLFPILFGIFQSVFLYGCGEVILLMIDINSNLEEIKQK